MLLKTKYGNLRTKWPQFLAVITGTIGTISDGMHYGWSAPVVPQLLQEDSPIKINYWDELWIENIYMIGSLAGLILTVLYVKKMGRKPTVILGAIKHLVAWTLIATTSKIEVLYFARFLAGIAGNIAFVSIPMYIAEIAEEGIRGMLGTFIYSNMMLGVLVIYCIAPFTSITVSSSVGAACVAIQILSFSFMPESPYYHLIKGNEETALKSLRFFRGKEDVESELKEIMSAVQRQESEKGRFIDLFIVKSNFKGLMIACFLNFAQHFSGISVLLMNLHTILDDGGSIISSSMAPIIVATCMLIACIASAGFIDKFGRKKLLISSSVSTGISLAVLASYFAVKNANFDVSHVKWIPLASVLMYSWSFKFGLGMVPIVLMGELFPTKVKAIGMTLIDISYGLFAILSVYLFMLLKESYGMYIPFFLFSGCCFLTVVIALLFIPETKGKTLEEIQMILRGETVNNKVCG